MYPDTADILNDIKADSIMIGDRKMIFLELRTAE